MYFPILLLMGHSSNLWLKHPAPFHLHNPIRDAGIVHVVCWIAQFVGHGVFEGRAPALLNSLFQCEGSSIDLYELHSNSLRYIAIVLAV